MERSLVALLLATATLVVAVITLIVSLGTDTRGAPAAAPPPPPVCQCRCAGEEDACPLAPPAAAAVQRVELPLPDAETAPVDRAYLQQPARVRGSPYTTRIDAGVLIPGRGEPMADATVVFDDTNTILFVGRKADVPDDATANRVRAGRANVTSRHARGRACAPGTWEGR